MGTISPQQEEGPHTDDIVSRIIKQFTKWLVLLVQAYNVLPPVWRRLVVTFVVIHVVGVNLLGAVVGSTHVV